MAVNLDSKTRGPNGRRILRLPRDPDTRPATAPPAPAAPPTQPERLDVFAILRASRPRRATRAQLEALAQKWGRK